MPACVVAALSSDGRAVRSVLARGVLPRLIAAGNTEPDGTSDQPPQLRLHPRRAAEAHQRRRYRPLRTFVSGFIGLVCVESLAVAVSEDTGTTEDVYEPYLLQEGCLPRTPGGRIATERAYWHLGITPLRRATLWDDAPPV